MGYNNDELPMITFKGTSLISRSGSPRWAAPRSSRRDLSFGVNIG